MAVKMASMRVGLNHRGSAMLEARSTASACNLCKLPVRTGTVPVWLTRAASLLCTEPKRIATQRGAMRFLQEAPHALSHSLNDTVIPRGSWVCLQNIASDDPPPPPGNRAQCMGGHRNCRLAWYNKSHALGCLESLCQ